ncbi:MAG: flagellar basal body rod protein FlgB [Polyangia bacterium]
MKIFDATLNQLERSLDVRLLRHNVLAANVANADTPGFRPKDLDFTAAMASVENHAQNSTTLQAVTTAAGHMDIGVPIGSASPQDAQLSPKDMPVVDIPSANASLDGNTVDLDRTMVAMAENALQYGASARAATRKLAILKYVASDGGT